MRPAQLKELAHPNAALCRRKCLKRADRSDTYLKPPPSAHCLIQLRRATIVPLPSRTSIVGCSHSFAERSLGASNPSSASLHCARNAQHSARDGRARARGGALRCDRRRLLHAAAADAHQNWQAHRHCALAPRAQPQVHSPTPAAGTTRTRTRKDTLS